VAMSLHRVAVEGDRAADRLGAVLRPSKPEPDAASAPPSADLACASDLRLRPAGQSAFTRAKRLAGSEDEDEPHSIMQPLHGGAGVRARESRSASSSRKSPDQA
jgi:hypothetical protein